MSELQHGIAWNDNLKLGNEQVDSQHYQIFVLLSDLIGSCEKGDYTENVRNALNFLVDYTVQHFKDEEILQIKYRYPDYERHKKLHEDFKAVAAELVAKFYESDSLKELSDDISKIVIRWIIEHIYREDKKIGVYIQSIEENPSGTYAP